MRHLSIRTILMLLLVATLLNGCKSKEKAKALLEQAKNIFSTLPKPGNEPNPLVVLGKKLYNEKGLSINDSQSCASCHIIGNGKYGVDNQPFSKGALGELGGRNSPTVYNAGLHFAQFWDGRAKDLTEQAKGPILNPVEMGLKSPAQAEEKIKKIKGYKKLFKKAFAKQKNPITYDNIAKAIAAYESRLITTDKFDSFLGGNLDALNEKELAGLEQFMSQGCTACHNGPLLGGKMYMKMGQVNPYANQKDTGRMEVTKNEADRMMFKVASLRNTAKTGPWFHDGAAKTLKDAIDQMAYLQLGKKLEAKQSEQILAFLNALTDPNPPQ